MKRKKKKMQGPKKAAKKPDSWTINDFVGEVWTTMKDQAQKNPSLKMLHAKLEPEWNKIIQKISILLEAKNTDASTKCIEDICAYGESAVRPLIDALLKLKSAIIMEEKKCAKGHDINE